MPFGIRQKKFIYDHCQIARQIFQHGVLGLEVDDFLDDVGDGSLEDGAEDFDHADQATTQQDQGYDDHDQAD